MIRILATYPSLTAREILDKMWHRFKPTTREITQVCAKSHWFEKSGITSVKSGSGRGNYDANVYDLTEAGWDKLAEMDNL